MATNLAYTVELKGADHARAELGRVAAASDTQLRRDLSRAGLESRRELALIMTSPARQDPFWGKLGTGGDGLSVRTGLTRARIVGTGRVYEAPSGHLYTFVGHPAQYMKTLEDGGIERGAPWIKIGTAAAQTPAGADKFAGRNVPGGFVWPTKAMKNFKRGRPKNTWIAGPGKNGKGLTLYYMLRKSVKKKPHHSFAIMRARMTPRIDTLVRGGQTRVVKI